MTAPAKYEAFLVAISELTREHKVEIQGCGCHGSPYLSDLSDDGQSGHYETKDGEDLRWVAS